MYRVGNPQSAPTASYAGGNGGQCGVPPAMPYPSHGQAPAHYSYGPTTTLAPPLPQPPPGPPPSSNCMPRYAHPSWQQQQQQQQPYSPSASYAQQQAGALPSDDQFGEHQQQLHGNQMMRLATWPGTQYSMGGRPSPTGRGGAYAVEGMALSAVGRANSEDISSRTTSEDTMTSSCSNMSDQPATHSRKRVRLTSEERIQRSRERNRVHARKTRKRKKVQMESLQVMIESLQEEGRRMRLAVMEWYTANILLVMRSSSNDGKAGEEEDAALLNKYMRVQAYLERNNSEAKKEDGEASSEDGGSTKDDPDGRTSSESIQGDEDEQLAAAQPSGGAGKTRTRCKYAPEDRERIRRERNRIHAKRTRDRRKKFMEDAEKILTRLAMDNAQLRELLHLIYDQPLPTPEEMEQAHAAAVAASAMAPTEASRPEMQQAPQQQQPAMMSGEAILPMPVMKHEGGGYTPQPPTGRQVAPRPAAEDEEDAACSEALMSLSGPPSPAESKSSSTSSSVSRMMLGPSSTAAPFRRASSGRRVSEGEEDDDEGYDDEEDDEEDEDDDEEDDGEDEEESRRQWRRPRLGQRAT